MTRAAVALSILATKGSLSLGNGWGTALDGAAMGWGHSPHMESKLAQFPRGTRFVLYAPEGQSARTAAEIHRFATEKGFVVTAQ